MLSIQPIVGIGATSPIGLTCKYLPLAEVISSAPNTSHIACHLRIPTPIISPKALPTQKKPKSKPTKPLVTEKIKVTKMAILQERRI